MTEKWVRYVEHKPGGPLTIISARAGSLVISSHPVRMERPDGYRLDTETSQSLPRSDEYKEDLKGVANRTDEYGERALEESDAVIAESGYGATGSAGWQVNAAGEV